MSTSLFQYPTYPQMANPFIPPTIPLTGEMRFSDSIDVMQNEAAQRCLIDTDESDQGGPSCPELSITKCKYRGVSSSSHLNKWRSRIGAGKSQKTIYLGLYDSKEEAARAYDIAALKLKGIRACTNFQRSDYDLIGIQRCATLPIGKDALKVLVLKYWENNPANYFTSLCYNQQYGDGNLQGFSTHMEVIMNESTGSHNGNFYDQAPVAVARDIGNYSFPAMPDNFFDDFEKELQERMPLVYKNSG